jgi:phytoene dehydrogenase-like protein
LWLYKSKGILPNAGLIARIIIAAKLTPKKRLISMKFVDFAKTVLTKNELEFLIGSFGYYSELVLMNAYDCCNLMMELDPSNQFYSLEGGLSNVIEELVRRIRLLKGSLFTGKYVKDIQYDESHTEYIISGVGIRGGKFSFISKSVVCALTKHTLEKLAIFPSHFTNDSRYFIRTFMSYLCQISN